MTLAPKTKKTRLGAVLCPGIAGPPAARPRPPTTAGRLEEIAAAIKAGASAEDFKAELDALLGTDMEDRDVEAEAHWEEEYRNGECDD